MTLLARPPAVALTDTPLRPGFQLAGKACSILLVDDEPLIRRVCRAALAADGVAIDEADNGADALALMAARPYDVVLLDLNMPRLSGGDVLARVRQTRGPRRMKVLVLSGQGTADHLSATLEAGADDFIAKPFGLVHLRARVNAQLRLKEAQDRADLLAARLAESNGELESALTARDGELIHARGALVLAMAKLVGARSNETGPHLIRLQKYTRVLAAAAAARPAFAGRITSGVLQLIEAAAPLHDIGKVAVPDGVLNKPGRLTDEERAVMQEHAAAGADTLAAVTARYSFASAFFHTAIDVARHHHERWDGTGYPDRLAGEAIPLSARVVAVGDVYDAMRSPRVYKPPMSHADTVAHMTAQGVGHFDPELFAAFLSVADEFDAVFAETVD